MIYTLPYSPNGIIIASGGNDKHIKLWQTKDNKLTKVLSGHQDIITSIALTPNSQLLASGSADKTVKLWHVNDGK
ncbi:MAG: hypothetical protein HRU34_10895 [Richelia sp.]|nr:hypothetical protein [Richelia sp.]